MVDGLLWESRKRVMAVESDIDTLLDMLDPSGQERYEDSDEFRMLDFLMLWKGRLHAANVMMRDVSTATGGGDASVS